MKSPAAPANQSLIDKLLEEQRQLTAVEKFSHRHEQHQVPAQQKYYRDLIPLTKPRPGEQFAFEVNLDACSGCKACVTACHSLNGLDENETWRSVGTLMGGTRRNPFQQTITTACHHCVEPGCLDGCPVEAYEKDFATGIVRHLDDQCIGCQYCLWTCPYEVPQFSAARGIVRKCDMCHGRLAEGEAPACVQACPNGAITIQIVNKEAMVELASQDVFLPVSPSPQLTIPSTRFVSVKPLPAGLKTPQTDQIRTQPAHWPLIAMLILTQAGLGTFWMHAAFKLGGYTSTQFSKSAVVTAVALLLSGLGASVIHLGRPWQAWRSFLGWKHSWLSREVLAFGLFAGLAAVELWLVLNNIQTGSLLGAITSSLLYYVGGFAVFCSAMLYHATQREFWRLRRSAVRFFGSALVFAAAMGWMMAALHSLPFERIAAVALILCTLVKLSWEISFFRILDVEEPSALQNSARLLTTKLRSVTGIRMLAGFLGGVFLPFVFLADGGGLTVALAGTGICFLGELCERYLFFTAVAPPKMPGAN